MGKGGGACFLASIALRLDHMIGTCQWNASRHGVGHLKMVSFSLGFMILHTLPFHTVLWSGQLDFRVSGEDTEVSRDSRDCDWKSLGPLSHHREVPSKPSIKMR